MPWQPDVLAELLVSDFEEVARRYEFFTEPSVEASRVEGEQRLAGVTTLRPRSDIALDGPDLALGAAM